MKFINVGFGNMVASERITVLASPDSAPMKRLVQDAKDLTPRSRARFLTEISLSPCIRQTNGFFDSSSKIIVLIVA